jgi:hypothetical protein
MEMVFVVGSILAGRFELRRRIGGGAMGEVYEALDTHTNEVMALKTLTRADGDTLLRFKREFRALQSTSHPNLAALRELVSDGEQWFFTMELVHGGHFLEYVGRDVDKLRFVLPQLVKGLYGLHEAGLVHRDVKPSNVMVAENGRVVVLDFGLVTTIDPGKQSIAGRMIGTIDYMAPEQAVGAKVTPAADWYSVGVMIYEALTGQTPYTGHALQILMTKQQTDAPPVTTLAPDTPPDLASLVRDLLKIEASARPDGLEIMRRVGASPHRPTPVPRGSIPGSRSEFVGRERELAALAAARDRSRKQPVVHLVAGESGIGKSELVTRWCTRCAEEDPTLLVLRGRCYERESVPYKALDGVIDGLTEHLVALRPAELEQVLPPRPALLLRAFPMFRRVEAIASARGAAADIGEPHEVRRRVFDALRALLAAVAARRPLVIAIDDLHWADSDSFNLMRELLRGADAPRVLVAATMRDGGGGDALTVENVAQRLEGVAIERTDLGPLSADESRMLAERIGSIVGSRDVTRVAREAGGHPMFLRELLHHLDTVEASWSLDDALWSRVTKLEPDAMALLGAICVAGAPITFDVAMSAANLDAISLPRAAAALRVATLAREIHRGRTLALEPYHDRVREAVVGHLEADKRAALHSRLAVALEDRARADPHELFRHFLHAGMHDRAAHYAEQAAALSHDAHAFDQAASLWRAALELVARAPDERRRLLLRLGEALAAGGRGVEAAETYATAAEGADRPTWLTCQRHITEQLLITGHIERGVATLQRLLEETGVHAPASPRAALWSVVKNRLRLRVRGLGAKLRERDEISDAEILRLDVLAVAGTGLSVVDNVRGSDFQTRALLFALQSGSRPHIARALGLEATYHASQGNARRAHALRDRARTIDDPATNPYLAALLVGSEGVSHYMEGDAREAAKKLAAGEALTRAVPGASWEHASIKLFVVFNQRNIGDYRAMRRSYDTYLAEAQQRGDQYVLSTMRRAAVAMWLAEDNPDGARTDIARATWVAITDSVHIQHFHALLGEIELALYTGDRATWRELHAQLDRCSRSLIVRIVSIQMQCLFARGRMAIVDGDIGTAATCAKQLAKLPSRSAVAWSLILHGCVARAKDAGEIARARFRAAAEACDAAGMLGFAAMARRAAAELAGDAAAVTAQLAILTDLGVVAPEKLSAAFVPSRR